MRSRGRRCQACLLALPCRWEAHGAKVEAVRKVAEHLAVLGHVHVSDLQLFALAALALAAVHSVTAQVWTSVERKGTWHAAGLRRTGFSHGLPGKTEKRSSKVALCRFSSLLPAAGPRDFAGRLARSGCGSSQLRCFRSAPGRARL